MTFTLGYASGFVCGLLGLLIGGAICAALDEHRWGTMKMDEEWCGCDGEGMAHTPGAEGFRCEPFFRGGKRNG